VLRSDVRLGRGGLTGAGLGALPPEDRERIERLRTAGELRRAFASSGFVRLVTVGQALTVQAVTVELLALEIRAVAGRCFLQWRAATSTDVAGSSTLLADIAMRDELGTPYQVGCDPFARRREHGGAVDCFFVPSPPGGGGRAGGLHRAARAVAAAADAVGSTTPGAHRGAVGVPGDAVIGSVETLAREAEPRRCATRPRSTIR
jgi:hypothetical protein